MASVIKMERQTGSGDLPAHARYSPHLESCLPELNAFADLGRMVSEANLCYLTSLVHAARHDPEQAIGFLPAGSDSSDVQWLAQLTHQDLTWFASQPAPYFLLNTNQIRSAAGSLSSIQQLLDNGTPNATTGKKGPKHVLPEGMMAAGHAWLTAVSLGARLCPQQVRALIPNLESTAEIEFLSVLTHAQIYQLSRTCRPTLAVRLATMRKALTRSDALYTMMGLLREARGPARSKR